MAEPPKEQRVDYDALLQRSPPGDGMEAVVGFLSEELPYLWRDAYLLMTPRPTRIDRIRWGTFEYLYDDLATLEAFGEVPWTPTAESRLVGVLGTSAPEPRQRSVDDGRLRGFIGRTNSEFGTGWDKGHFIGHQLGGRVTGLEINVFVQRRALNRGWSAEGKVYRSMERYCSDYPGTFCFARPFYSDDTSKPSFIEFGVLRDVRDLWVQIFDNRGLTAREVPTEQGDDLS